MEQGGVALARLGGVRRASPWRRLPSPASGRRCPLRERGADEGGAERNAPSPASISSRHPLPLHGRGKSASTCAGSEISMTDDLHFLPATELRERIARREVSAVEAVGAALGRAERLQPEINCFITIR